MSKDKKPCMQLGGQCECLNPNTECERMSSNRQNLLGNKDMPKEKTNKK